MCTCVRACEGEFVILESFEVLSLNFYKIPQRWHLLVTLLLTVCVELQMTNALGFAHVADFLNPLKLFLPLYIGVIVINIILHYL